MAKLPSEILAKTKAKGNNDKDDKNPNDKDDKKMPRRNALIDFISKAKKGADKD